MAGKHKGGQFEREICKKLSEWWTEGQDDDVFWRTQSSGARATQRFKMGKVTRGQIGDVCAVDGRGISLIKLFTISLKRGYSSKSVQDLMDNLASGKEPEYAAWIREAIKHHKQASSLGWALIVRKDRRESIILMPLSLVDSFPFNTRVALNNLVPSLKLVARIRNEPSPTKKQKQSMTPRQVLRSFLGKRVSIYCTTLDGFLSVVDRKTIRIVIKGNGL